MKWLTLVWLATAAAADDQCDGPVLQLQLRNGKDTPPRTLYGVLATFGGVPLFNMSQPAQLVAASPLDACSPLQQSEGMCVLCMCVCVFVCRTHAGLLTPTLRWSKPTLHAVSPAAL